MSNQRRDSEERDKNSIYRYSYLFITISHEISGNPVKNDVISSLALSCNGSISTSFDLEGHLKLLELFIPDLIFYNFKVR